MTGRIDDHRSRGLRQINLTTRIMIYRRASRSRASGEAHLLRVLPLSLPSPLPSPLPSAPLHATPLAVAPTTPPRATSSPAFTSVLRINEYLLLQRVFGTTDTSILVEAGPGIASRITARVFDRSYI